MEKLLYQSEGNPQKRENAMKICAVILVVCGMILALLSMLGGRSLRPVLWMGLAALALGVIFYFATQSNSGKQARLYLYEQHVEGTQVSPYKTFNLRYDMIDDVQKLKMFSNEMLLLQSGNETYTVLTDDVDTAYRIVCDKVYGEK